MPKFKIGDRVRILRGTGQGEDTKITVVHKLPDGTYYYGVDFSAVMYYEIDLERIEDDPEA